MPNKKADFTLTEFMKIILAVVSIGLLLYLAVSLYGLLIKKTDIEQARGSVENLLEKIKSLEEGETPKYTLESPKGWYLVYFEDGGFIWKEEGATYINSYKTIPDEDCSKNCLCICPPVIEPSLPIYSGGAQPSISQNFLNIACTKGFCKNLADKKIEKTEQIVKGIKIDITDIQLKKQNGKVTISENG